MIETLTQKTITLAAGQWGLLIMQRGETSVGILARPGASLVKSSLHTFVAGDSEQEIRDYAAANGITLQP